jgi:hypothetical protein
LKKSCLTLLISFLVLSSLLVLPSSGDVIGIQEGTAITYTYVKTLGANDTFQMGDALYSIEKFNSTYLEFTIEGKKSVECNITYTDGYPRNVSRLEALIYLPPQAIQQSQQGNLNWVDEINAPLISGLLNKTVEPFDLTTDTGTYTSVKLTLKLLAGTLIMIYDVDSGGLIYQEFHYPGGDVITQSMKSIGYDSPLLSGNSILSLIMPILTLVSIVLVVLMCLKRKKPGEQLKTVKDASSKNVLVFTLVAAVLAVVAVFVPWSQTQTALTYLPYSLPTYFTYTFFTPAPALNFLVASVTAHLAAITTWVSVGLILLSSKKTLLRITSVVSIIFAIVSVALFLLTGQSIHVGMPLVLASVALLALSLVTSAKIITITIEPEKPSHNKPEADQNQL